MLYLIQDKLVGLVRSTWASDEELRGQRVALYRQYAEGEHRAKLTPEMRNMLRVKDDRLDRFNANYCDLVASALADRLQVTTIEGQSPEATTWAHETLEMNRFDALMMDVHEAALIDGDTYVMVAFDETEKTPIMVHEPAYDGDVGMVVVYDRMRRKIIAAVKVWWEGDSKYMNLYTPGKVEKLVIQMGAKPGDNPSLAERDKAADWTDVLNEEIGVPVIHFRNKHRQNKTYGESELVNAIPLQDVLNRTLYSMVMTSELSAFLIPIAKGFTPPASLMPGAWITISAGEPLTKDQVADVTVLPQASLVPFISQCEFTIDQISSVTQTPIMSSMGSSSSSGEALKQRESGLISKARRAQVRFGNAWEDTIKMAAKVNDAFNTKKAPPSKLWKCLWKDAQVRNDTEEIDNAMKTRDVVGDEETLRQIGKVRDYDEEKIKQLMAEKDEAAAKAANNIGLPGFKEFGTGTDLNNLTPNPSPMAEGSTPQQPPNPSISGNPNDAQTVDINALQSAMMQTMGA